MDTLLEKFPLMSVLALIFVVVGAVLTLNDTITYAEYLENTMKVLLGLGVIGGVRVFDKYRKDGNAGL